MRRRRRRKRRWKRRRREEEEEGRGGGGKRRRRREDKEKRGEGEEEEEEWLELSSSDQFSLLLLTQIALCSEFPVFNAPVFCKVPPCFGIKRHNVHGLWPYLLFLFPLSPCSVG